MDVVGDLERLSTMLLTPLDAGDVVDEMVALMTKLLKEKHRVLLPKSVSSSRGFLVPSSCQVSCTQRS